MSRRLRLAFALFSVFAGSSGVMAQEAAEQVCQPFRNIVVPEAVRPTLAQAGAVGSPCSPFALYYSGSYPNHFVKARWCGLAQLGLLRGAPDPDKLRAAQQGASGGATSPEDLDEADGLALAMLFQNGEGVARDTPLAKSLVCKFGFDSPEANPDKLPALLGAMERGERFDICGKDSEPQGRSVWYACAGMQATQAAEAIQRQLESVQNAAVPALRPALHALIGAWAVLDAARSRSFAAECDGGTGCGVFTLQDQLQMDQQWLRMLEVIASGRPPADLPPAAAYPELDEVLNQAYKAKVQDAGIIDKAASETTGGVVEESVVKDDREMERAWIRYRDAWVAYAARRWPEMPADRWRGWLTRDWTKVLGQD